MAPRTTRTTTGTTRATRARPTAQRACATTPTEEQIRMRAFEIFLRRNGGPGDALSDWIQAEQELRAELAKK